MHFIHVSMLYNTHNGCTFIMESVSLCVRVPVRASQVSWSQTSLLGRRGYMNRSQDKGTACHWLAVWPAWARRAVMAPWQRKGPPPSPRQPTTVSATSRPSTAASPARVRATTQAHDEHLTAVVFSPLALRNLAGLVSTINGLSSDFI